MIYNVVDSERGITGNHCAAAPFAALLSAFAPRQRAGCMLWMGKKSEAAMETFIDRLRNATREELEAPATLAVRKAISNLHRAGISTTGVDSQGSLVIVYPDGSSIPLDTGHSKASQK